MKKGERRKKEFLEKISSHILQNGLEKTSLKHLAEVCETSDRMLVHYFSEKDTIISLSLEKIANDFLQMLDQSKGAVTDPNGLLALLLQSMQREEMRPYLRIFLELMPQAARKEEPYISIGKSIAKAFSEWITESLEPNPIQREIAALVFALAEGFLILDTLEMQDRIPSALQAFYEFSSGLPKNK